MPKINREEYEVLKALDSRAKSIVRQARGWLWVAEQPIMKDDRSWFVADGFDEKLKDDSLFQFIQWEDEEPYNIAELIKEYKSSLIKSTPWTPNPLDFESEDIGMKNIEWAKIKVQEELDSWKNIEGGIDRDGIKYVLNIINQLDEPEVLSQEWIDKHAEHYEYIGSAVVPVDDLQNLIVPKQEEVDRAYKDGYEKGKEYSFYKGYLEGLADKESEPEKVVVPQFVAEFIEVRKDTDAYSLQYIFCTALERSESDQFKKEYDWIRKNEELFAKAWLAYPNIEVEEEQKYRVLDGNTTLLGRINGLILTTVEILEYYPEYAPTFDLTEQEIKDFDPRYWAFRKTV